jgi:hypothetical protein
VSHENIGACLHNHHIHIVSQCVFFVAHCANLLEKKIILEIMFSAEREFDIRSHRSLRETRHTGTSVRQRRHFAESCFTCELLRQETNGNSAVGLIDK